MRRIKRKSGHERLISSLCMVHWNICGILSSFAGCCSSLHQRKLLHFSWSCRWGVSVCGSSRTTALQNRVTSADKCRMLGLVLMVRWVLLNLLCWWCWAWNVRQLRGLLLLIYACLSGNRNIVLVLAASCHWAVRHRHTAILPSRCVIILPTTCAHLCTIICSWSIEETVRQPRT